jgi:hypothetical protein
VQAAHSGLGFRRGVSYGSTVIGILRFVGVLNAAVWFGTGIFFTFGTGLAPFSKEMRSLLGPSSYPYLSGAIAQILIARYFYFQVACAIIAVVHLLAERLYFGKYPRKLQVGLLIGLCTAALVGAYWLQPTMNGIHARKYAPNARPEIRAAADHSFRAWHGVSQLLNLFLVGGVAVYLWQTTNPSDHGRFVSAVKFTMR